MVCNSNSYYWNFLNFKAIYGFVRVWTFSWCSRACEYIWKWQYLRNIRVVQIQLQIQQVNIWYPYIRIWAVYSRLTCYGRPSTISTSDTVSPPPYLDRYGGRKPYYLLIYFVYLVRNPYRILLYRLQAPMQLVGWIRYYWAQQPGSSTSTLVVLRRSCGFNDSESYLLATNSRMWP